MNVLIEFKFFKAFLKFSKQFWSVIFYYFGVYLEKNIKVK